MHWNPLAMFKNLKSVWVSIILSHTPAMGSNPLGPCVSVSLTLWGYQIPYLIYLTWPKENKNNRKTTSSLAPTLFLIHFKNKWLEGGGVSVLHKILCVKAPLNSKWVYAFYFAMVGCQKYLQTFWRINKTIRYNIRNYFMKSKSFCACNYFCVLCLAVLKVLLDKKQECQITWL